ncbi:hypothetical protein AWB70_04164 [Caballeronia cordobensis]|uniref:Uncharacterized protein n=1 Tax=Caballeronia cordobensis TaxID=1353886 RepID=A0A158I3I4_CABCO|nr:hypothetical protein [Caballeronia cordobensis]SAL51162.1 hypothetical protein AWB70_04164 [Caballeronia cordobensis]
MSMPKELLEFDQAVHGYKDGHRQLYGSTMLDLESADTMTLASDLLISRSLKNNESYLTGYPLKGAHKYVFARTWPAPEMSRPGCVWTHSLIIDYLTVSKIDDALAILSMFKRPTIATLSDYGSPINFSEKQSTLEQAISEEIALEVVHCLYAAVRPQKSRVIFANRSTVDNTSIALSIWSQMPPRLRRAAAFCTGDSASTVPSDSDIAIGFSSMPTEHAPCDLQYCSDARSGGMRLLAKDLTRRLMTPLRQFLRRYSVDVKDPLAAIRPLAEFFDSLRLARYPQEFRAIAAAVGEAFPTLIDARSFKQDLLLGRFFDRSDALMLRMNCVFGTLQAVDRAELPMVVPEGSEVSELSNLLARTPQALPSVLKFYRSDVVGDLVRLSLADAASQVPASTVSFLGFEDDEALAVARLWPSVLHERNFWLSHRDVRRQLLDASGLDSQAVSCFIDAFWEELNEEDFRLCLVKDHEVTVSAIGERWRADDPATEVSTRAIRSLAAYDGLLSRAVRVAGWLPRVLWKQIGIQLASAICGPEDDAVWAMILARSNVQRLGRDESALACVFFIWSLSSAPATSTLLINASFDLLYNVAWNGQLVPIEQEVLERGLPRDGVSTWDYCRRLARALVRRVITGEGWEVEMLSLDLTALTIGGVIREIESRSDALDLLRCLEDSLDRVSGAERRWSKALKAAIKQRTSLWSLW